MEALKQPKENKDMVIIPPDKGSAIVIMDRKQYLWEGYRPIKDKKYYKKLTKPIYLDTIPSIKQMIQSLYKKGLSMRNKIHIYWDMVNLEHAYSICSPKYTNTQANEADHIKFHQAELLFQTAAVRPTIQQNFWTSI